MRDDADQGITREGSIGHRSSFRIPPLRSINQLLWTGIVAVLGLLLVTCSSPGTSGDAAPTGTATLSSPARLTAGSGAQLLVTDPGSDSVCSIDASTRQVLSCFGIEGSPLGIAWSANRTYVGNATTHAIEVYDPAGAKLSTLPGTFVYPTDMAIDEQSGLLFVLDGAAKTISLLTLNGYPVRTITGDSAGPGQLVNPAAIAVDTGRQQVLVSDYGVLGDSNPAWLRIYDYAGTFITAIEGKNAGFSRPQGLAAIGDTVLLADGLLGKVLLFTRLTSTVTGTAGALGSFGDGPGQLMLPLDVVVDGGTLDVYVTSNRTARIERFAKGGLVP